ncbi:8395_t:CDS:2 [Cetraspora pellucida]|uniref:8395_t:CDS:1 n=1 Tax=Cetraspora pellucida TaxID=1433469 RepID=A0A9N9BLE8_9GLOM|nr:8395_t:CDS:2 [Cetraspora pellucida]
MTENESQQPSSPVRTSFIFTVCFWTKIITALNEPCDSALYIKGVCEVNNRLSEENKRLNEKNKRLNEEKEERCNNIDRLLTLNDEREILINEVNRLNNEREYLIDKMNINEVVKLDDEIEILDNELKRLNVIFNEAIHNLSN